MWARHQRVVKQQNSTEFRDFAREVMVAAFSKCPKLEHLVVAPTVVENGTDMAILVRRRNRLFADLWKLTKACWELPPDSSRFLNDVIADQASIGSKLRQLTMLSVGPDPRIGTPEGAMPLTAMPPNLNTLRLNIRIPFSPTLTSDHQFEAFLQSLGTSSHLQSLMINMNALHNSSRRTLTFAQRLASFHWPNLHSLKLRGVALTENILVAFLLRHRESLQRLAIRDCNIRNGTWDSLFTRIANKLPNLKLFRLQGWFLIEFNPQFWFPDTDQYTDADTLALQRFVLEGGDFPQMRPRTHVHSADCGFPQLEQPMVWEEGDYSQRF